MFSRPDESPRGQRAMLVSSKVLSVSLKPTHYVYMAPVPRGGDAPGRTHERTTKVIDRHETNRERGPGASDTNTVLSD